MKLRERDIKVVFKCPVGEAFPHGFPTHTSSAGRFPFVDSYVPIVQNREGRERVSATKMPSPDPEILFRIIAGENVFDLDTDSLIRQAANGMSARAMFEVLKRMDTSLPEWPKVFAEMLKGYSMGDPGILIGFDDGRTEGKVSDEDKEDEEFPDEPSMHYLRLRFTDADACYYQYHVFPAFDEPFIMEVMRKREEDSVYLQLGLTDAKYLQVFIQKLRSNPHLLAVDESDVDEFNNAESQAV